MTDAALGQQPIRVLFVCTHNSARSIMAEALLRHHGGPDFEAFSAGTEPGEVRPLTLRVLHEAGLDTRGLRAKSVDELREQHFDYVITVCDQARQACPAFPGNHHSLHWGYEDPSTAAGSEEDRLRAFRRVCMQISGRVTQFVSDARRAAAGESVAVG
ncbi:MAG TPA: arsenate reductase ArsC [Candidatus Limnocylindrales bacterium]|nr:arsenate reductase ArsC [Candidatus Limnocylindrales bacterium]